jgi:hypothetical protein
MDEAHLVGMVLHSNIRAILHVSLSALCVLGRNPQATLGGTVITGVVRDGVEFFGGKLLTWSSYRWTYRRL